MREEVLGNGFRRRLFPHLVTHSLVLSWKNLLVVPSKKDVVQKKPTKKIEMHELIPKKGRESIKETGTSDTSPSTSSDSPGTPRPISRFISYGESSDEDNSSSSATPYRARGLRGSKTRRVPPKEKVQSFLNRGDFQSIKMLHVIYDGMVYNLRGKGENNTSFFMKDGEECQFGEVVEKIARNFGENEKYLSDFGVYLRIGYLNRDKREMKTVDGVWNELFELGLAGWVRNIAGRFEVPGFKDAFEKEEKEKKKDRFDSDESESDWSSSSSDSSVVTFSSTTSSSDDDETDF